MDGDKILVLDCNITHYDDHKILSIGRLSPQVCLSFLQTRE